MSLELIYNMTRKMELFSDYIHRRKARLLIRHKLFWEGNLSHADVSSLLLNAFLFFSVRV